MITTLELEQLKAMCARIPGALALLAKVPAVKPTCWCCYHRDTQYCQKWDAEIPTTEMQEGCGAWDYYEVPF